MNYRETYDTATPLELKVLRAAVLNAIRETGGEFGYSDDIKVEGLNKQQVGGVISSLLQKRLVYRDDEFGQTFFGADTDEHNANVMFLKFKFSI